MGTEPPGQGAGSLLSAEHLPCPNEHIHQHLVGPTLAGQGEGPLLAQEQHLPLGGWSVPSLELRDPHGQERSPGPVREGGGNFNVPGWGILVPS